MRKSINYNEIFYNVPGILSEATYVGIIDRTDELRGWTANFKTCFSTQHLLVIVLVN